LCYSLSYEEHKILEGKPEVKRPLLEIKAWIGEKEY
jgi:hypothetical protein